MDNSSTLRFRSVTFIAVIISILMLVHVKQAFSQDSPSKVSLIAKTSQCQAESECEFAVVFDLKPEWHVYWKNPGDSGASPKFSFISPPHLDKVNFNWPVPKHIPVQHLVNFGYEGKVYLPFTVPTKKNDSVLELFIRGEWLVCKEDCIPEEGEFKITHPVGDKELPSPNQSIFNNLVFPVENQSLPSSEQIISSIKNDHLELILPYQLSEKFEFFSEQKEWIEANTKPSILVEDNKTVVSIRTKSRPSSGELSGVVKIGQNKAIRIQVQQESLLSSNKNPVQDTFNFNLLLLALFGGILLNFMPCVLPIIAIKAISASNNQTLSFRKKFSGSVFYSFGVIASILSLYAIVVIAKYSGVSLGWGFQLQNPYFAGFFGVFFLLLALNLFGLFQIPLVFSQKLLTLDGNTFFSKNFFSGIVTTLISTPCTAPFAGVSIAYALQASNLEGFIIFLGLGIGLALPFALVILIPGFAKILPKPGKWMSTFKKICAIPILLTSLWLFWVVSLQTVQINNNETYEDHWGQTWTPFSKEELSKRINSKETVYLDFTAAWCITCQVNKSIVFQSRQVRDYIKDNKIVLMRADWTNNDPKITEALKEFNRISVPFNVIYKKNEVIILPTVLTPGIVLEQLS